MEARSIFLFATLQYHLLGNIRPHSMRGLFSKLSNAQRSKTLVRITRSVEKGWHEGYVVKVSQKWFVLLGVGEGIMFAGYRAFRLKDVSAFVDPAPYAEFVEKALRKRKLRRPKPLELELSSIRDLLHSAIDSFPLVTVRREIADPSVCHIGQVWATLPKTVLLQEIGPDAVWDRGATAYPLADITRIDFGGPYEEALALVAGPPPRST